MFCDLNFFFNSLSLSINISYLVSEREKESDRVKKKRGKKRRFYPKINLNNFIYTKIKDMKKRIFVFNLIYYLVECFLKKKKKN